MDIFLVWIMGCGKSHILVSNKLRNTESKPRLPTRIFHPFTGLWVQRADYTLLCLWLFSHLICFESWIRVSLWIMGCGKSHILVSNKLRNTESKPRLPTRIFHPFTGLWVQRANYTLLCLWLFSHLICFAIMDSCITCMVLRCMPWIPVVVQHSPFPSTDEED